MFLNDTKKDKKECFVRTDLSSTVGMKSYPMPSTSYWVLLVLLSSSGSARMEPSGSTPTICTTHTINKQRAAQHFPLYLTDYKISYNSLTA